MTVGLRKETAGKTPPDSGRQMTSPESAVCLGRRRCFPQSTGILFLRLKTKPKQKNCEPMKTIKLKKIVAAGIALAGLAFISNLHAAVTRSEERRVGKECISRWA